MAAIATAALDAGNQGGKWREVSVDRLTLCRVAGTLGAKLGALLFQLPPALKKDLARLDGFLASLPPGAPAAFEFRHASWFDDEVFARLRQHGKALRSRCSDIFVYFKHEEEGKGAAFARELMANLGLPTP